MHAGSLDCIALTIGILSYTGACSQPVGNYVSLIYMNHPKKNDNLLIFSHIYGHINKASPLTSFEAYIHMGDILIAAIRLDDMLFSLKFVKSRKRKLVEVVTLVSYTYSMRVFQDIPLSLPT
ncbi:hypothetical protein F5X99DRAFT_41959 [Biscogniauxia marginata]|nr:hypothetical protein F5X99DRAFT_41959 [Biscogniauxia marginata]